MNVQSLQTQSRQQAESISRRRFDGSAKPSATGRVSDSRPSWMQSLSGVAFNESDESLRMQHGPIPGKGTTNEFWDVVQTMSRKDQISMASLAVASQVSQNGVNNDNSAFISDMRNRFSSGELKTVRDLVKSHSMLKSHTEKDIKSIMKHLKAEQKAGHETSTAVVVDQGTNDIQIFNEDLFELGRCRRPPFDIAVGTRVIIKYKQIDPIDGTLKYEIQAVAP
ncbi:MAG: hypothetical protein HQM09_23575 [Candidatus Riflebacteria bacterium]|nr:hypothetical protein [Candidatus Riflebacteria bacterium]